MTYALQRAIVGPLLVIKDDDEVPMPYRRTVPLPPAPVVNPNPVPQPFFVPEEPL